MAASSSDDAIDVLLDHEAARRDAEKRASSGAAGRAREVAREIVRLLKVAEPTPAAVDRAKRLIMHWLLVELGARGNAMRREVTRQASEKRVALGRMTKARLPKLTSDAVAKRVERKRETSGGPAAAA